VGWACLQGAAENSGSLRRAKAPCAGTDRRSALFRALRAGGASAGEASALISCGRRQWATNEHHWSASLLVGCDDDYGPSMSFTRRPGARTQRKALLN
jgi:hypothetical protein